MPEVSYTTVVRAPRQDVWDFVKDMGNWAPLITGYQDHEVINELDSMWTLKGDVGVLSRKVRFRVHITEWTEPTRVAFTMTGETEQIRGEGIFELSPVGGDVAGMPSEPVRRTLLDRFLRWLYRMFNPDSSHRQVPMAASGPAAPGSQLGFRLKLVSEGMVGPVVDAMIEPLLRPAAEDLANKIADRLEAAEPPANH